MKQQTLRLPDDLHAELAEWAKREERSMHSLILYLLRRDVAAEHERRKTFDPVINADIAGIGPTEGDTTEAARLKGA